MIILNQKAITLVEMLIIIVILSVIASITLITVGPLVEKTRLNADLATVNQLNVSTRLYRMQNLSANPFEDETSTHDYLLNLLLDTNHLSGRITPQSDNAYYAWQHDFQQWTLIIDDAVMFTPTNPEHFTVGSPSTFRITSYNLESGTDIVIPSEINDTTITEIGFGSLSNLGLTSIVFPNTITTISGLSIRNNSLTALSLNDGLLIIGNLAFDNNQITEITIPNSVTTIGDGAFNQNPITRINIGAGVHIGNTYSFGIHRPGGGGNFNEVYAIHGAGTYQWNGTAWVKE